MVDKAAILLAIPIVTFVVLFVLYLTGAFNTVAIPGAGLTCNLPSIVCPLMETFGFPSQWLNTQTFLFYSIIPILAIWLIILGFLSRIHIFDNKYLNGVLSFLIAFSTVPLGVFVAVVSILFSIMGVYSVILFIALFFMGTGFFARAMYRGWSGGMIEREMGIEDLVIKQYHEQIDKRKAQINFYLKRLNEIKSLVKNGKMAQDQAEFEARSLRMKVQQLETEIIGFESKVGIRQKEKKMINKSAKKETL